MSEGARDRMEDRFASEEREDKSEALRMCLQYLYREAMDADLRFTAHLIGLAAESLRCRCGRDLENRLVHFMGGTRQ